MIIWSARQNLNTSAKFDYKHPFYLIDPPYRESFHGVKINYSLKIFRS